MAKRHVEPQASLLDGSDLTMPADTGGTVEQLPDLPGIATAVAPSYEHASRSKLADLRDNALAIPVEQMQMALTEYADRRLAFYSWLLEQMTQGVHYGVPPGIKQNDADPRRWKSKPSLYKAGADFVCDLMGLRDEYDSDLSTWEMLGKPSNIFVRRCRLFSRTTGALVGEGTGARQNGAKSMDVNGSIKMADKTAKVAAIINTYGLSDLFSQDLEDLRQAHDNPEARDGAPEVPPRGEREEPAVTPKMVTNIVTEWKTQVVGDATPEAFANWVLVVTGREFNTRTSAEWTAADFNKCADKLGMLL